MFKNFTDPNDYKAESDSAAINLAIADAKKLGCNRVKIPSFNKRTKSYIWTISETISLPSHICIELDNAHLRMADGVFCQMFRNENAFEKIGATADGLQKDITIQGYGNSILDGGKHNGLREKHQKTDGLPGVKHNLTIYFHNVKNFKIDNITIRDQRWWSMCFLWASFGIISNIRYELTDITVRESLTHQYRNQDGIDLRIGCHDIQISNISGETGDDVVALTALAIKETSFEREFYCNHLPSDIWNVQISNIRAFNCHCALVRLLCHNRNKIYNIDIDHLIDATPDNQEIIRTASCVKIGENDYCNNQSDIRCKDGEMHDINVSNVFSNALAAVVFNCNAKNVTVRNINVGEKGQHAVAVSKIKFGVHSEMHVKENITNCQNILIDGINFNSKSYKTGSPFYFDALIAKNFRVVNINYPRGFELVKFGRYLAESEKIKIDNVNEEE